MNSVLPYTVRLDDSMNTGPQTIIRILQTDLRQQTYMRNKMNKVKYLILGAGPAGLTLAARMKQLGETSFLILEKESQAGGLCRSVLVDGSPFDIGGGHFLDRKRPKVTDFLFQFMPEEEWEVFERDSRIWIDHAEVGHPLESNIWQFDLKEQVAYLTSVSKAGCNLGQPMPERFVEWIVWKLGRRIADHYMLPYNQKMFSDELDELGTYWLEKLPDVSFEETLLSCLTHKPYGTQPGHAHFYYPKKYGYGELWLRMAGQLSPNVLYGARVSRLYCDSCRIETSDGDVFEAEHIITTIPWRSFEQIIGMPEEISCLLPTLKSSAIETRYVPENLDTAAQWIYVPDLNVPWHRILVRHNFCQGSRGYWLETRKERTRMFDTVRYDPGRQGMDGGNTAYEGYRYMNEYAYPLNTVGKPEVMEQLLAFCASRQIYGLGRWGEHCHYNSDVVVELAIQLAEKLAGDTRIQ